MALPVTANLYAHYEADTLGLSNGASVTSWPDASGNGNTLAQTGGASLPTYETNSLNGMGGVKFGSSTRRIADTSLSGAPSTKTIFMVVKNPTNNGTIRYVTNTATLLMAKWSNADRFIFGNSSGNFLEFTETGIVGTQGQWTYVHKGTGSFVRWNQVQKVSGNINAPSTDTAIVLGDDVADMDLTIYEYIVYSAALSSGDIDLVEDYLFDKWFVAGPTAIGKSVQMLWDTRAAIGDTSALVWDVKTPVGDTSQFVWDVSTITAIGDQVGLVWDAKAAIGDPIQLVWDVASLNTVGDPVQFLWDIRAAIGDPLALRWDVEADTGLTYAGWGMHI